MKRDINLIREILLYVEKSGQNMSIASLPGELSADPAAVEYAIELLKDGDTLVFNEHEYVRGLPLGTEIVSLSPDGREFMYHIRDEKTWNRVLDVLRDNAGHLSVSMLRALALSYRTRTRQEDGSWQRQEDGSYVWGS